jgi:phage-related protein
MQAVPPTYKAVIAPSTKEFLDALSAKERAAAARQIQLLEQFGPQLTFPHVRHIKDKTWEIRIRCNKKIFRLYYYIDENRQIQISYGFHKTSNHIPKKHKKLALKRTKRK